MVRVATVQAAPVSFDLHKSVAKAARLVAEAREGGAQLVVLPEAFLSAYPRHFVFAVGYRTQENREWYAKYVKSAVKVPEDAVGRDWLATAPPQTEHADYWAFSRLAQIARDNHVYLSIGIIERSLVGSTVWCCNLIFGPDGVLLAKHRKLKPTGAERMIWHEGEATNPATHADGSPAPPVDNIPVVGTEVGKMGAVICWENYMPLLRYAMYKKGVELYLAPTADGRATWLPSMQHIALEGRCFVITANQYQENTDFPADYPPNANIGAHPEAKGGVWSRGGSAIVGPMGDVLAGPLWDKEGILYADGPVGGHRATRVLNVPRGVGIARADALLSMSTLQGIDTSQIHGAKLDFDPVGHYSREPLLKDILAKL